MALVGNFLPKPTILPMHISNPQKPKTMIVCATPDRPKTSSGGGGKINSTLRVSTRTIIGVKEVTPNTTLEIIGEDNNQKSKANYVEDGAAATVKGAEPTD